MSNAVAQGTTILEMARFTTSTAEEAAFVAAHERAMAAIKRDFPSLEQVHVVKLQSSEAFTTWVDVAIWRSPEEAHRAAVECHAIPEFQACISFMRDEGTVEHGQLVATY